MALRLAYRPPLAWSALGHFLAGRGAAACEQFDGRTYRRTLSMGGRCGWISVTPDDGKAALRVELSPELRPVNDELVLRLRRLFDLEAPAKDIAVQLAGDPRLAAVVAGSPGLRIPGTMDGFDIALRAVIGQQISVNAATTVYSRIVSRYGRFVPTPFEGLDRVSPSAADLARVSIEDLRAQGLMQARARTIQALSTAVASGRLRLAHGEPPEQVMAGLIELPGIGPWTAQYVAMRALGDRDVFPRADLGLLRALGLRRARDLEDASQAWRPWRAYAALYLWQAQAAGG